MLSVSHKVANVLFGFKQGGSEYPCHWCGIPTDLRNAEDFHVCDAHQREEGEIGYDAMKAKYPLAGKENRNPEFFQTRREHYANRAARITHEEARLLIERGKLYAHVGNISNKILRGESLEDWEIQHIGYQADCLLDRWRS
jgi:hypothetical protein